VTISSTSKPQLYLKTVAQELQSRKYFRVTIGQNNLDNFKRIKNYISLELKMSLPQGIDIEKPRFPQNTYINRAKHFILVTNPLVNSPFDILSTFLLSIFFLFCFPQNVFASEESLNRAAKIVQDYRAGKPVTDCKTEDDLWNAKYLYDSAFHPDTGGNHSRNKQPLVVELILSHY
jgi:hypothetical protein